MAKFNYDNHLNKQFKQVLAQYGEAAAAAAKEAISENAEELCKEAKSRCPVKTGKLKDSIHVVKLKKGAVCHVVADAKGNDDTPYARIVEFSPKIDKPFMYPAFDSKRDQMKENVIMKIREALTNVHR